MIVSTEMLGKQKSWESLFAEPFSRPRSSIFKNEGQVFQSNISRRAADNFFPFRPIQPRSPIDSSGM